MSNHDSTGFQSDNPQAPVQDRGLFDCFGKKEETEDVPMTEAEHKPSLMEKLHRSNSSSSSSSEEEVEEDGVKIRRRKKKGLTDKVKEKLHGHNNEGAPEGIHPEEKKGFIEKIKEKMPGHHTDEVVIAPAPAQATAPAPPHCQPGGHCGGTHGAHHKEEASIAPHLAPTPSPAHATAPTPPHCHPGGQCGVVHEPHESQEKKGIIEKIMDMLPGGNKDGGEAKKDY